MTPTTPVIVAALRTPVGTAGHSLADVDASTLAATLLARLTGDLTALGIASTADRASVDHVVLGNCMGPGGNLARVAALAAGLGEEVPGVTVDRQCGSGQEAIHQGAALVALGQADLVLAGGVESASTAPWRIARPAGVFTAEPAHHLKPYPRAPFAPPGWPDPDMGPAAQDVADRWGIERQRQDAYALRSHERTLLFADRGANEIVPVDVSGRVVARDDRPRRLSPAVLARLPGAFRPGGSVTAGNSCAISDGAAIVAVVPERVRAQAGVRGLAIRGWQASGSDPAMPGVGPLPAVRALLGRLGVALDRVDAIEITEAFAAQVLACTDELGLHPLGADSERVCPWGGAIALGHPWGASGALLAVRLFSRMVRHEGVDAGALGLATCAIGGGQGLAMLVERVGP
ncbi:MAG: thiolase family protein [Micrococcales bacterium]|nr:thiolase family protein [Micrococcales bacterium]